MYLIRVPPTRAEYIAIPRKFHITIYTLQIVPSLSRKYSQRFQHKTFVNYVKVVIVHMSLSSHSSDLGFHLIRLLCRY